MRFNEIISEAGSPAQQAAIAIAMKEKGQKPKNEGMDEDLSRRGFLKGLGAAAAAGAASSANATPFKHGKFKDEMTGAESGSYTTLKSDYGDATIQINWNGLTYIGFIATSDILGIYKGYPMDGRIKISDKPVKNITLWPLNGAGNHAGGIKIDDSNKATILLAKEIMSTPGSLKIELPVVSPGGAYTKKIFQFTIEPDNKSKQYDNESIDEGETWSKHNNKRAGGMSKKSVASYRRSHPGSKIQTAVTTKPSKLKKGSKAAKRRASFCARMRGMKKHRTGAKTANDPNSNINKSLRRWHCESIEELHELVMLAEQFIQQNRKTI